MLQFKNLKQLESKLNTQEKCLEYYESIRFEEGYFCPHCDGEKHYKLKKKFSYRCANKECEKTFNVLTGTIFENTKIPLSYWFTAIFIFTTNKKGISSIGLSEYLGITQKSSWFMLHRIREMLREKAPVVLSNEVEIDAVHLGGKAIWKHDNKKKKNAQGRQIRDNSVVVGIVERDGGKIITKVVPAEHAQHVLPLIQQTVEEDTIVNTDENLAYHGLYKNYDHHTINHQKKEYVKGKTHTQTIEGAWSLLRRGIYGIYHQVSKKHLSRYCDEFSFRYNTRSMESNNRFDEALRQGGSRLLYKALVS